MFTRCHRPSVILPLLLIAATGMYAQTDGPDSEPGPTEQAMSEVDAFLTAYQAGATDEELLSRMSYVREWSITLRGVGDQRAVEPLAKLITDTTHSEQFTALAIYLLGQLRGGSAVPAIKWYLHDLSKPHLRLQAAAALCVLGEAETGLPVLEEYAAARDEELRRSAVNTISATLLENRRVFEFPDAKQESLVTAFFLRAIRSSYGRMLIPSIAYLLQKGKQNQEIALQRAEGVLRPGSKVVLTRTDRLVILGLLSKYGGDRGEEIEWRYDQR